MKGRRVLLSHSLEAVKLAESVQVVFCDDTPARRSLLLLRRERKEEAEGEGRRAAREELLLRRRCGQVAHRVSHSDIGKATGEWVEKISFILLHFWSFLIHFQSPIDIVPSKAKADDALRPLEISYAEDCVKNLANTGNSWKADVDDGKASASSLTIRACPSAWCSPLVWEPFIFSSERWRFRGRHFPTDSISRALGQRLGGQRVGAHRGWEVVRRRGS